MRAATWALKSSGGGDVSLVCLDGKRENQIRGILREKGGGVRKKKKEMERRCVILIGSLAKQGIDALVPNLSLTFTIIISCPTGAIVGAAFFFFSFLGSLSPPTSLCAPLAAGGGDAARGRGGSRSRYPRYDPLSFPPLRSSWRVDLSLYLNPPPPFPERGASRRRGGVRERDREREGLLSRGGSPSSRVRVGDW